MQKLFKIIYLEIIWSALNNLILFGTHEIIWCVIKYLQLQLTIYVLEIS